MVKISGGEALVKSLVREGVEAVFGIGGIHMSGTIVALRDEPGIRLITTRHEAGATHMADGYARASGNPGVALVVPGIDSGYSFNLGFSFPTALGAKVARPDRPVVCVIGDGGFMFNAAELATAVRYGINVVTIVFRDDAYGNVGRDLDEMFHGTYETDLLNPDLVKFAESFGAVGMRADDPMDLKRLLPLRWKAMRPW